MSLSSRVPPLRAGCGIAAVVVAMGYTCYTGQSRGVSGQVLITEGALSAYLMVYALIPMLCLLAVQDARHATNDAVLLRSGSYRAWLMGVWTRGLVVGATNAALAAAGAVVGALTWPTVATASALLVLIGVHAVCAMVLYGATALTIRLVSSLLGAFLPILVWMVILVGWWSGSSTLGLRLFAIPEKIIEQPLLAALFLWPPALTMIVAAWADRSSRRPSRGGVVGGYVLVAIGCTLLLATTGMSQGAEYVSFVLLAGIEPGVGLRLFLFSVIVHLGYALAATAQWEQHLAGPWTAEAIRCGTVAGWAWRHGRAWVLGAFVVPAALLAIAFGVALGTGTTGPALAVLTPASAYHLLVNGGLQITLYALACLVVRWLSPSEVGGVACLGVLFALCAARLLGVPVPGIATNGLISGTDQWTGALATSVALFVWLAVLLTLFIVVTRRHPNPRSAT